MSNHITIPQLEAAFRHELAINPRAAAETAYALAFNYRDHDVDGGRRFDLATFWANEAIRILDSVPDEEIEDVACTRSNVGDVPIPDLFHAGTVRRRLADVLD